MGKLIVLTGLDAVGKDYVANRLVALDAGSSRLSTPTELFHPSRESIDRIARTNPAVHYYFYLASVIHASFLIDTVIASGNVYCVRYLIDTVVYHRALGLEVQLDYETDHYQIRRPDMTILLSVENREAVRQTRLTSRGHLSFGDRMVDDALFRALLESEYESLRQHYQKVINLDRSVDEVAAEILELVGAT